MHFSGRFLYNMMQFASLQGANIQELMKESDFQLPALVEESRMVDSECYNRVIRKAMDLTGDNFLGLHAGEYMSLSTAGLVGQITQSSSTIKQAMQYACDFANLGCRAMPKQIEEFSEHYKMTINPNPLWLSQDKEVVRQTADGILVFTIREFQSLSLQKHLPLSIEFSVPKPKELSEYERVFPVPLKFNCERTAITFAKEHVEAPVISADYRLLRVLVELAYEKLAEMEGSNAFFEQVKKSMINLVNPQFPTIEEVATNLNVGVRTMQRKLSAEGHTFKNILESLRKDFAMSYMKRPDLSINEIAYLLNYSDGSTFIRSFKRWTGETPQVYRQKVA